MCNLDLDLLSIIRIYMRDIPNRFVLVAACN